MIKNTLSLNDYTNQKTNKDDCEKIAIAIAQATKRAWEDCRFTAQEAPNIGHDGKFGIQLAGYVINFQLHSEVDKDPNEIDSYATVDSITNNGKYESINVDEIEHYLEIHNADWYTVEYFYFKHLPEFIDTSKVELFSFYQKIKKGRKYLKVGELRAEDKDKAQVQPSNIYAPSQYTGEVPTISVGLTFATYKQINAYIKTWKKSEEDYEKEVKEREEEQKRRDLEYKLNHKPNTSSDTSDGF